MAGRPGSGAFELSIAFTVGRGDWRGSNVDPAGLHFAGRI